MGKTPERALPLVRENKQIAETNRQHILRCVEDCRANNLSLPRRVKYLYTLPTLARRLQKGFEEATVEDIKRLVGQLNDDPKYSDWSKSDFRVALKRFYRWLRGLPAGQNPPETVWILHDLSFASDFFNM